MPHNMKSLCVTLSASDLPAGPPISRPPRAALVLLRRAITEIKRLVLWAADTSDAPGIERETSRISGEDPLSQDREYSLDRRYSNSSTSSM